MDRKRCVVCGEAFEARVDAKTCSNACRQARHRNRPKPWMIVVHEPEPEPVTRLQKLRKKLREERAASRRDWLREMQKVGRTPSPPRAASPTAQRLWTQSERPEGPHCASFDARIVCTKRG